jgi:hypothetical protein
MTQRQQPDGGLHRREFLLLGSAATVGMAASMSGSSTGALGILAPARQQFAVGYAEPLETATQHVMAADRLPSGDAGFLGNAAHVTVHGLWRPESRRNVAAHVGVTMFHPLDVERIPFLAWRHSGISSAAAVSFTTPVQPNGTLAIGIDRTRAYSFLTGPGRRFSRLVRNHAAGSVDLPLQETMGSDGSVLTLKAGKGPGMKLRRGTYFVALVDGGSRANWSAVTAGSERNVRADSVLRIGGAPVDFEYLVISVDRA